MADFVPFLLRNRATTSRTRCEFVRTAFLLAWEGRKTTCRSVLSRLPVELRLHLLSLIFTSTVSFVGKSNEDIAGCTRFIFDHADEIRRMIADAVEKRQSSLMPAYCITERYGAQKADRFRLVFP